MPVYRYEAFDAKGDATNGIVDATSPREAREKLRNRGVHVTDMTAVKKGGKKKKNKGTSTALAKPGEETDSGEFDVDVEEGFSFSDIDLSKLFLGRARRELVSVTRLLATLLKAGINLVDAMTSIIQQIEDPHLGAVMRQIREALQSGVSFADGLAQHPELFDALYVNMVRAGEASGALDEVLKRLADFMQAQGRMRNRVSAALTYPIIMIVLGFGVVCFLLAFVVPKIVAVVQKKGGPLPLPTEILLFIQALFMGYWWLGLLLGFGAFMAYRTIAASDQGAMAIDTYKLRMPVLGDLFRKQSVARFATTFATLLRSGIQATDCLKILANVVDNKLLGKVLIEVRERIIEGTDISTPIKKSKVFPPVVGDMIAIGEESGQLEDLLERIAEAYDDEVEITSQKVTAMIEPLIIVCMAFVVGFIVLSVVLPLTQGFQF
jgi:type II secretory pathway component PulF